MPSRKALAFRAMVLVLCLALLCQPAFSETSQPKKLEFSEPASISELEQLAPQVLSASGTLGRKTIEFEIHEKQVSLGRIEEFDDIRIEGLKAGTAPGEPKLPFKSFTIELEKDTEVKGITIEAGSYRELLGEFDVVPVPQPSVFVESELSGMLLKNRRIYALNEYFPGGFVTYEEGEDNEKRYAFVRVFPLQYNPATKKALLLTDARIIVHFGQAPEEEAPRRLEGPETLAPGGSPAPTPTPTPTPGETPTPTPTPEQPGGEPMPPVEFPWLEARNIIITHPSTLFEADHFRDFHHDQGLDTYVVDTDWIWRNYAESDDPDFNGYSDSSNVGWGLIHDYNYAMAKRIISYIADTEAHPMAEYITIFGDANLVPPSYYYFHDDAMIWLFLGIYEVWIPTDFFYGSPDLDIVPNYAVGRIPFSSDSEAEIFYGKQWQWNANASWDWFKNAAIGGNDVFKTSYYKGELVTNEALNQGHLDGMTVAKYFGTNSEFDEAHLEIPIKEGNMGIYLVETHGLGNLMLASDGDINSEEVLEYLGHYRQPVVLSVACINGVFDTDLMDSPYHDGIGFGEALLRSQAGAIAYFGSARSSFGGTDVNLDEGYVFIDTFNYIEGLMDYVAEGYAANPRIGDWGKHALASYAAEYDLSQLYNERTLLEFTLLGDPALEVPALQPGVSYSKPVLTAMDSNGMKEHPYGDMPYYYDGEQVTINVKTDSPGLRIKRIDVGETTTGISYSSPSYDDTIIETIEAQTSGGDYNYVFTPESETTYLVRFEADDGKEGWMYLGIEPVPPQNESPILLVDDAGQYDYREYYTDALDARGFEYDVWDTLEHGELELEFISYYKLAIWFTGKDSSTTLLESDQTMLTNYLLSGGALFITGQDIGYDIARLGNNEFYSDYLHAEYVKDDTNLYDVNGVEGDPITGGIDVHINGEGGADNQRYQSETKAINGAVPIFHYDPAGDSGGVPTFGNSDDGTAGLRFSNDTYSVVYLSFGFEAINSSDSRALLMQRIIEWAVDDKPPQITSVSPAENSISQAARPAISADFNDNKDINTDTIIFELNGADILPGAELTTTSETAGEETVITGYSISYTPGEDLGEGKHNVLLVVTDHAGNQASMDWNFYVDTAAPTIISQSPEDNGFVAAGDQNFIVTYTEGSLKDVNLYWNETYPYACAAEAECPPVSLEGCVSGTDQGCYATLDLSSYSGEHAVEYYFGVFDTSGKSSFKKADSGSGYKVSVDQTAPSTTISAPETWTSQNSFAFTASDAGIGVARTIYRINGGTWIDANNVTFMEDGNHKLEFYSIDGFNNQEAVNTAYFPVDTTAPDFASYSVSENIVAQGTSVQVLASATDLTEMQLSALVQKPDESTLSSFQMLDDGAHSDGTAGDGIYGASLDTTGIGHGVYFIDINAIDEAGNSTEIENLLVVVTDSDANIDTDSNVCIETSLAFAGTDTNTVLDINVLQASCSGAISIVRFSERQPGTLAGLGLVDLNIFLSIELSEGLSADLNTARVKAYYREEAVAAAGLSETDLFLFKWSSVKMKWLPPNEYALAWGVNTEDNYVWADVNELSDFSVSADQGAPGISHLTPDKANAEPGEIIGFTLGAAHYETGLDARITIGQSAGGAEMSDSGNGAYTYSWDTTGLEPGEYGAWASLADIAGNTADNSANPATVTLAAPPDPTPPPDDGGDDGGDTGGGGAGGGGAGGGGGGSGGGGGPGPAETPTPTPEIQPGPMTRSPQPLGATPEPTGTEEPRDSGPGGTEGQGSVYESLAEISDFFTSMQGGSEGAPAEKDGQPAEEIVQGQAPGLSLELDRVIEGLGGFEIVIAVVGVLLFTAILVAAVFFVKKGGKKKRKTHVMAR